MINLIFSIFLFIYLIDVTQDYGVNCSHITIERIWSHVDVFAYGHFLGWMFKVIFFEFLKQNYVEANKMKCLTLFSAKQQFEKFVSFYQSLARSDYM